MDIKRLWQLCQQCAQQIWDVVPPNARYADLVARQLLGTCAQESGGEWERQRLPNLWDTDIGGFSKWQVEKGSILASLAMLRQRHMLLRHATDFVFADSLATLGWIDEITLPSILWAMRMDDNDKLGVLFARLHYLRDPWPIQATLRGQADTWKRDYNTVAGAGTPEQYIASWNGLCEGIVPPWVC